MKGDLQLCSNYRTIALISHTSKVMTRLLMKRLEGKLKETTSSTQAGYVKHRGTRDHIFNLRQLFEKCCEKQQKLFVCFVDYSKAFDNARHSKLWQILREKQFPLMLYRYWNHFTTSKNQLFVYLAEQQSGLPSKRVSDRVASSHRIFSILIPIRS